jgi:N-acetylglucosaminyl-diphospho-decaprenol L-rhamnosyltransferase
VINKTGTDWGEHYSRFSPSRRNYTARVKLSVIIPTYDTAEMTLVCCASVMEALPADAEVIVVDDASTDDSARRIGQAFPSITVLRQAVNRGFSASVNAGVFASRGKLVLLLNSDTRIARGTLDAFVRAFEEDERLGVAGAQLIDADGTAQWSAGPVPTMLWMVVAVSGIAPLVRPFRRRRASANGEVGWVSGAAMAFRRSAWDAAGPMREDFRFYAQDLDFCVRARRAGWSVRLLSDIRVEHLHGATIARGNALPYKPELLWLDLLTWGRGEYGEAWARRARRWMIVAAAVRSTLQREFRRGYEALRDNSS